MSSPASELLDLLTLERLEDRLFRGQSRDIGTRSVFGGQVLGQALAAAQATLKTLDVPRQVHSLHAYFLRAGDITAPIVYEVDVTRDGGSFSVRRVTAIQHGQVIFFCAASFQRADDGVDHHLPMPKVPAPDTLAPTAAIPATILTKLPDNVQRWLTRAWPFDIRQVSPHDDLNPAKRPPCQQFWFCLDEPLDVTAERHCALLAYASDFRLLAAAILPHGISYYQPEVRIASLDHALWFHRPFRIDEWLLYSIDSPSAQDGRGLARGLIYNRQGELVASCAQEGMIRVRTPASPMV